MTRTSALRAGAVAAGLAFGMALQPTAPAFADPPPWAPAHGWRAQHYDDGDEDGYPYPYPYPYPPPPMIYGAPPPVVYPPPAVYAPPVVVPPSLNIVVPLNFR